VKIDRMFFERFQDAVPKKYRAIIPEYIKDYVSLNQFWGNKVSCHVRA
jgi:hypothetical protein